MPGETITVESAIKKGRWQLSYIPIFILFASLAVSMIGIIFIEDGTTWMPIWGFSSFGCAFVFPLLYYFIMLPRWRIWAFSNVRNVHELKSRANLEKIYPNDDSFYWRMEIKTKAQKEKIKNLEDRFNQPDIFVDDPNIAFETKYAYSNSHNIFYLLLTSVLLVITLYLFVIDILFAGVMGLVTSSYLGWMTYKRFKQKGPVFIISNDGITVYNDGIVSKEEGFYSWKDVANERVVWVSAGKASKYVFAFDVYGVTKEMDLRELTGLSSYKIDHVLRTYRGRYEASLKK